MNTIAPVVELVTLSPTLRTRPGWDLGPQRTVHPIAEAIGEAFANSTSDAILCLDEDLPLPDAFLIASLLQGPSDVWHAGLRLGLEGQPQLFDHVNPLWMLNDDVDPTAESTSWRLSLRALLVRTRVSGQLGGPRGGFETLAGAGLETGLRWIRSGALVRHVPGLIPQGAPLDAPPSEADGLQLVALHHGRAWAWWALQRALITRELGPGEALRLGRAVRATRRPSLVHYLAPDHPSGRLDRTVSVIIPTLDRYTYLEPLLHQLSAQSIPPHQVIVADQTAPDRRRGDLPDVCPELPVTVLFLPTPGQSTARNAALRKATGELLLFIDDDDEIGPDLIAEHLKRVTDGVDASCGGVDDATAGPPPEGFQHRRASDVFPTNNVMVRRSAVERSGMFDLTYDRGPRADHDLGMRLHRDGALLIYDPAVMLFHHHASSGGLRTHGARTITWAGARRSITKRDLPAVTELYLGLRYFSEEQNREGRAIRLVSLLSGGGARPRQLARALVQLVLLPGSARAMATSEREARSLLRSRHPIPELAPSAETP